MCGITFCVAGIPATALNFNFDLFSLFYKNHFLSLNKKADTFEKYLDHVLNNKLFIDDFTLEDVSSAINQRGPDFSSNLTLIGEAQPEDEELKTSENSSANLNFKFSKINPKKDEPIFASAKTTPMISMSSSVLNLRGDRYRPHEQPIFNESTGNALMYNGELYAIDKSRLQTLKEKKGYLLDTIILQLENFDFFKNDGAQLFQVLDSFSAGYSNSGGDLKYEDIFTDIISVFEGDFALVFFDSKHKKIVFGKDPFGKRSLLLGLKENGFCISSCPLNAKLSKTDLTNEKDEAEEGDSAGQEKQQSDKSDGDKSASPDKPADDPTRKHNGLVKDSHKEEFLIKKYSNEYFISLNKNWLELPANNLYFMTFQFPTKTRSLATMITRKEIYAFNFEEIKEPCSFTMEELTDIVLKRMRQNIKNLIQNIHGLKTYFQVGKDSLETIEKKADDEIKMIEEVKTETADLEALKAKKRTTSSIAVLFSGGLDSTMIAGLVLEILPEGER